MAGVRVTGTGRGNRPRRWSLRLGGAAGGVSRISDGARAPEFRLDWIAVALAWMVGRASPLGLPPLGLAAGVTSAAALALPGQAWAVALALAVGASRAGLETALETVGLALALVLCHRLLKLGQGRAPWFAAGWAALVLGGGLAVVLAWGRGAPGLATAGVQAALAFGGTVFFAPGLAWLASRGRSGPEVARPLPVAALLVLVGLALGGLGGLGGGAGLEVWARVPALEAYLSPRALLDAQRLGLDFLVISAGYLGGAAWGALAGVALSTMASLSGPLNAGVVGAYALGGLLAGVGRRGGRAVAAAGFLVGVCPLSLAEVPLAGLPVLAAQVLLAAGALLLVPRRALGEGGALPRLVGSALGWGGTMGATRRAAAATLEELGSALRELGRLARPGPADRHPSRGGPAPSGGAPDPAARPAPCRQCPLPALASGQLEGASRVLLDLAREAAALPAGWAPRPGAGAPPMRWEAGVEGVAQGPEPSGDAYLVREFPGGRLLAAVSDGVGTGSRAREVARGLLGVLSRFLGAGLGLAPILAALNAALLLRPGAETSATLDLWWVDLVTGQAEFAKFGAPPGYLRRGGRTETVGSTAPPVGGVEEAVPDAGIRTLGPGDLLVLATDGVMGGQADGGRWMRDFLGDNWGLSPRRLASAVLERARERSVGGSRDDATAVVVKFYAR